MNKSYLKANIIEAIERAKYLKNLIHRPIEYPEIIGLVEKCSSILDGNILYLNEMIDKVKEREENDIRDLFRSYRQSFRAIRTIEYFGIPALHYQTDDVKFLNKLIFKIHNEINLPFVAPCVACYSNKYYWIHGITNVVFMPIGEAGSMLHLPDIFHELGHATIFNKDNDYKLEAIKQTYEKLIDCVTSHYEHERNIRARQTGPEEIPLHIDHWHSQWKERWLDEFFSDLFACYTLGPAYVWAHLHVTTKTSDDIFHLEKPPIPQSHPSDESRMRVLENGLKLIGFIPELKEIIDLWEKMPFVTSSAPIHEYQFAYPKPLMKQIAELMLDGMKKSGFSILTPDELRKLDDSAIRKRLNDAWREFWRNPNYIEWEKRILSDLKKVE